ncbi:NAD-dependent epimerase/dehydratase family protein [Candidatus Pelagibacter sp.]|nr:NAD-dependent epimerase/dehydratase family protein [Candidatus Pelagibacter sp.]
MIKNEIVVTGGLGFIGSNFVKYLDKKLNNHKIIIYDKSKKNYKKINLRSKKNKISIIIANTLNIEKKLSKFKKINTIFHFGEFSRIVKSFDHANECFTSNTLGTFKVLKFCKDNNIKVVYSASSSKFGNNGSDEHLSPYSWTKSKNIELIKNFYNWYGLKYEIVFFYNVYGNGQSRYGKLAAVIGIFEGQYLQNKPLTVVSPGTQLRDFTHVDDIVNGTYLAWKKNLNKEYLLGTGKLLSIINIAKLFNHKIKKIPSRQGERLSSTKISNDTFKILKYKPKIKIQDYLKNFVKNNK